MKRTFSALLVFVLAVIMCVSAAALSLDTAELAADEATDTEASVIVPGINVINGTTEIETFEGEKIPSTVSSGAFGSFALSTEKAVSGTQSIKGVGNGTYPKVHFDMVGETGRKYFLNVSIISNYTAEAEHAFWLMENGAILVNYSTGFKTNSPAGNWYTVSATVTSKTDNPFYLQTKGNGGEFYFDDIAVIPYYKITYIGLDGETVAATDYVLFDSHGEIMNFYIPDLSKVEGATGYALTAGGERIADVALENKDIVLYAIDTPVVGLAYDSECKNFTVEGETYTFPAAEDVFDGIANFLVYSDGYSFYKEGDEANAADVIGKTFTAVCTTYKEFDEKYGELVLFTDYDLAGVDTVPGSSVSSGNIIASYRNTEYLPSGITHTDGNAISTADVVEIDGNRVLKLTTKNNNIYNYWSVVFSVPVAGKFIAFENVKVEDTQGTTELAKQFGTTWHRFNFDSTYKTYNFSVKPTANWQTFTTESFVSTTGIKGSGFSYNRSAITHLPNIYKDNHAVYVYPSYAVYFKPAKDVADYTKTDVETTATTYTFPEASALGYETENFYAWTNGTKYFKAGEETALANVQYTVFYPVYQSVEEPAMGFTFEGDVKESSVEVSEPVYTENIVDDGRDVLLVHWFKGQGGKGLIYPTDLRLSFKTKTYSNPAEYNILQYSVKADRAWNVVVDGTVVKYNESNKAYWADTTQTPEYTALTSKNYRIYAHQSAGGSYTSNAILAANTTINMSDSYVINEYDLAGVAGFTERGGYGFCVDPLQATYGAYVYMDYLRVYRKGLETVTYDTNAPDGAVVTKNVAADTNRGLGYGYLLKDERPAVEGYIFLGWGLTPDATETVNSITVDGNETVYAVWAKEETVSTPEMTDEPEIRGNGKSNGIRFKAEILPSEKKNLDEFGFLATREVLLPYTDDTKTERNHDYLTFNHKVNGTNANYYVQGIAYDADGGIDIINSERDSGEIVYTTVLSGIPMENKEENMVVRSYAKFTVNGKEMIVYGNTNAASLYDTALAIKTANGEAYKNNQTYIDEIVG